MQKFILFIFLLFSVFCLQAQIDPSTGGKGKKTKPETSKFGKKGNTEVDINKLYPFPNNLDELIVPEGKTWGTKSVADWWANLPDDTKDYILSDAMEPPVSIESIYFDTTTFANNVEAKQFIQQHSEDIKPAIITIGSAEVKYIRRKNAIKKKQKEVNNDWKIESIK